MSRQAGDQVDGAGTEIVRRRTDRLVSTTVVRAVADARGTEPLALPPLADVLDPDALDTLCAGAERSRVAFDYAGHRVRVAADGTVTVSATGAGLQGPA